MVTTILELLKKSAALHRRRTQEKQSKFRSQLWFWRRWYEYRYPPRWKWLFHLHYRKIKKKRKFLRKQNRIIWKRRFLHFYKLLRKSKKIKKRAAASQLKKKTTRSIGCKYRWVYGNFFKLYKYWLNCHINFCFIAGDYVLIRNWRRFQWINYRLFFRRLKLKICRERTIGLDSITDKFKAKTTKVYGVFNTTRPRYIYFFRQKDNFQLPSHYRQFQPDLTSWQKWFQSNNSNNYLESCVYSHNVFLPTTKKKWFLFGAVTHTYWYKYMRKFWRLALKIKFERFFFMQVRQPTYIWFYSIWGLFFKHKRKWRRFEKKAFRRLIKQRFRKLSFIGSTAKIFLRTLGLLCFISGSFYCFLYVLATLFKKHRGHWQLIKILQRHIRVAKRKFGTIRFCRILINGKFNGAMRARKQTIVVGGNKTKLLLLSKRTSYSYVGGFTKWGIFGIHIWLQFKENAVLDENRFSLACKKYTCFSQQSAVDQVK